MHEPTSLSMRISKPQGYAHARGTENNPRQKVLRLVTRLGIRDAADLLRGRPALVAHAVAGGDARLDEGTLAWLEVLR